jgi:hypothetical protein
MNTASVQKFLSDINCLPMVSVGGYLMEKYNELSMVRSMKSNSSLVSMLDNKGKRNKGNGNGSPKMLKNDEKFKNSKESDDSPISNKSNKSEKSGKSSKNKLNNKSNTLKSSPVTDGQDEQRNMCIAFNTEEGCKFGEECRFIHDDPRTDGEKKFIKRYIGNRIVRSGVTLN